MSVTASIKMLFVFLVVLSPTAYAQQDLPIPVKNALNYRRVPEHTLSVFVESLDTGAVVLSWNEAEPRNPESVEKMLTTIAPAALLAEGSIDTVSYTGIVVNMGDGDALLDAGQEEYAENLEAFLSASP